MSYKARLKSDGMAELEITDAHRKMFCGYASRAVWFRAKDLGMGDIYTETVAQNIGARGNLVDSIRRREGVTVDLMSIKTPIDVHDDKVGYGDYTFTTYTWRCRMGCPNVGHEYPVLRTIRTGAYDEIKMRPGTAFVLDPKVLHWVHMTVPRLWQGVQLLHPRHMSPYKAMELAAAHLETTT